MKKLFAVFALLLIVAMALPACAPAAADCKSEDVLCVGLVTDVGKIDDKSFNQSAWEGVKQAEKELGADRSSTSRPPIPRITTRTSPPSPMKATMSS